MAAHLMRVTVYALALLLTGCSFVVTYDGTDHTVSVRPVVATQVHTATATPSGTPTATATATATLTPTATVTPTLTATSTASVTSTPAPDTPTPTQEVTVLPSTTPRPTNPPPDESVCMAGVVTTNLNIRADHNTTAAVTGKLPQSTRVEIVELYIRYAEGSPAREEWGRLADGRGWIALWHDGTKLAVLDDNEWCWGLPKSYAENPLPIGSGFHVLPGQGAQDILAYAGSFSVVKCLDGSWQVCDAAKARNGRVVRIARTLTTSYGMIDCPQDWNWESPATWWAAIRDRLPAGYDYYEVMNECPFPPKGAEYLARWSIEIAKLVERDKGGALLAFSFAPGNPDYPEWPKLVPYLQWAEAHPLPDGRRHGIALHAAAYAPWSRADSSWINNPHITPDRYLLFVRDVILANTGVDVLRLRIPVVWTEIGVTDGYSGSWQASYTCQERASAYLETRRKLALGAVGFAWWNVGQISRWTSDHECLPLIFG